MAAKTLTGNPIVVGSGDTFATVTAAEARVRISGFYWATGNAGADADTVVVAHADGSVIWAPVLDATDVGDRSLELGRLLEAKGLAITPPTHGTLYVYLADSYA
jgi:hypothetical protein